MPYHFGDDTMLFNSLDYALFFPIVFILYWFLTNRNLKLQNILLLVASYFFYASWDYRFLVLLMFSTFVDYFTGLKIYKADHPRDRKFWLWLSVGVNLGFLGVFKYYNFFISSFTDAISIFGFHTNIWTLQILLPLGISFYTFHGLSYILDIYNKKISPTTDVIDYAVFVGFFPLLVAGPIERATHLLPQIKRARTFEFEKGADGLRQILWGLFKKIVIADNCAVHVDRIFNSYQDYSGSTLAFGVILFSFQIYCDFSGYSDIAIGSARLLGFDLLRNFAYPYFSRDIAEFWRRWHISLTTWFRDYLYIPLGGSRGPRWKVIRNALIIFLISGFWHGANWTFIAWGLLHTLYYLPLLLAHNNRRHLSIVSEGKLLPGFGDFIRMVITFACVTFAWIFFRAESIPQALSYINHIFFSKISSPVERELLLIIPLLVVLMLVEWLQRSEQHGLAIGNIKFRALRWGFYIALAIIIFCFGADKQNFIYFQF